MPRPAARSRRLAASSRHCAASRSRAIDRGCTGATIDAATATAHPSSHPTIRWSISVTGVLITARAKASMRVVPAAMAYPPRQPTYRMVKPTTKMATAGATGSSATRLPLRKGPPTRPS